jgi:biotin transport system substrate-specific component
MKSRKHNGQARVALACLFAALCCAGSLLSIPLPIGPIPIVLGNFFAVLAGLLLGPLWGSLSSIIYLAVGALGFPVFSGGSGGLAHFVGPTGGYLAGYVLGAFLAGAFGRRRQPALTCIGSLLGFVSILALGTIVLKLQNGITWGKAIAIGMTPFIVGDAIKMILAAVIALRLGAFVDSLTGRTDVST